MAGSIPSVPSVLAKTAAELEGLDVIIEKGSRRETDVAASSGDRETKMRALMAKRMFAQYTAYKQTKQDEFLAVVSRSANAAHRIAVAPPTGGEFYKRERGATFTRLRGGQTQ